MTTTTARLITIPFSHFCEKARWALDRRGVDFVEEAHLPMLHRPFTRRAGGSSTPVLVVAGLGRPRVVTDSTDILRYADEVGTRGAPLFLAATPDVEVLEARFDDVLGPHSRRLGYAGLLADDRALRTVVRRSSVPALEKAIGLPALPLFKLLLRRAIKITPERAQRSEQLVREVFAEVEARLADGRRFLCGDTFTAADLTFAALSCPIVMPPAYERFLLPFAELPDAFRSSVARWRESKAGAFALSLYEHERRA